MAPPALRSRPNLSLPVSSADHRLGPENAVVTLVEYGDIECPYSAEAFPVVQELQRAFGDHLRLVFRHFPLYDLHPHARSAAEAAESAGSRGKFWPMLETLFENSHALSRRDLVRYASRIGDDAAALRQNLDDGRFHDTVENHLISGRHSGVDQTPTFFINGVRLEEQWSFESLSAAIEQAIQHARPRAGAA
jgi:protein-disulfide isomerase